MVKLLKDYALYIDETEAEFSLVRVISETKDAINMIVIKSYSDAFEAFDKIRNYFCDMIAEGGFNDTDLSYDDVEDCLKTLEFLKSKWM